MSKLSQSPERKAQKTCRKKKRYASENEARDGALYFWNYNRTKLRPYACGDHYHLTKGE